MSICWFSSTSRFRDVIPNDVKGETIPLERRLAPCFNTRPRCILMPGVSRILALFFAYTPIYLLFPSTTLRDLRRSIAPENYSTEGAPGALPSGLVTPIARSRWIGWAINATHADVTVDNLEIFVRAAQSRHWSGKERDRRLYSI